jgi:leucyl/phenylalanyl-tRNA--protein transferase
MEIQFPDPNQAEHDGLLAVGGELTTDFLLAAYSQGIYPWYNEGDPILWWSPDPRMVLFPEHFICSKSLQRTLKSKKYAVRTDENFYDVIEACASVYRRGQKGTWITNEMVEAYTILYEEGYAHSVETYIDGVLAGGLYGVSLGKIFFGESMFYKERDASKIALYYLNKIMLAWDFHFIDVQQSTGHLRRLGASEISRKKFLHLLQNALQYPTKRGKWKI